MSPLRIGLAAIVVVVLGISIVGIGMGDAPRNDPAPTATELAASKAAIAKGGADVQEGKHEFAEQHCGTCHALAATGEKGQLGPRMDAQDDEVGEIAENIAEPRKDIKKGYEANLMPTDYAKRMSREEIQDVATFIQAASTKPAGEKQGGDDAG